ncbi:MAG: type II toxin-antitoxin system prevent-host-death family antitoxin [Chloroflexi bacterium]|nr:type II toxin-antitoxin system prevent-host-death family antitoxin [Chloroflexota bacterium]
MTTKTVEVEEARQHLAELVAQVAGGAEIILTEGHTPRARLVPIAPQLPSRVPGLHIGMMTVSSDFDTPLPDDFWTGNS